MPKLLVTGSSGLIGSEVVGYFFQQGWDVSGIDNNMRAEFFGPAGDTRWNQKRLQSEYRKFRYFDVDIRDRVAVQNVLAQIVPDLVVHAAAQPSHDLAASRPFDDFDVNAVGTLNMLEGVRRHSPDSVFIFLSTNKVYGDRPNTIALKELPTRWGLCNDPAFTNGIDENFPIDQSKHSLMGASKLAADIMVQEYGRYFGIRSCVRARRVA